MAAGTDDVAASNAYDPDDPDINSNTEQGKMLLISWVDCGTFDLGGGSFVVDQDIKDALVNQAGIDPGIVDAVYAVLPDSVKNLPFTTSQSNVSAVAGIGTLQDVKDALSTVTFHAPNVAGTCTFTTLVDDLGNHGFPGYYKNLTHDPGGYPTGFEAPAQLIAFDSVDYDVTGPTVDVEQAVGQADPTPNSPIHFRATFTDDMQGFGDSATDTTLSGTAGATTATVTPIDAKTYDVAVTGMTQTGTVIVDVPAGAAQEVAVPGW